MIGWGAGREADDKRVEWGWTVGLGSFTFLSQLTEVGGSECGGEHDLQKCSKMDYVRPYMFC